MRLQYTDFHLDNIAQPLTEINKKVSIALSLSYGQCHDTTEVVLLRASLLLAEVPDEASTDVIRLRHDIEQEWFNIVEKRLVVEEHL